MHGSATAASLHPPQHGTSSSHHHNHHHYHKKPSTWAFLDNLYFYSFFIFTVSLLFGTVFYKFANAWDWALAYYFAASVLLGDMYLVPTERSELSQNFTLLYFLWGTILMAGAIASAANAMIDHAMRVAAEERKRILYQDEVEDVDGDGMITWYDHLVFNTKRTLNRIGWYRHRSKYLASTLLVVWFSIGVLYGALFEGWPLGQSIFFTISAMSAAGSAPPTCDGGDAVNCTLGTARSLLIGTYLITAVPIFAYFMGQFAELLVEHAIRAKEIKLMMRPLSEEEFQFACELQHGNIMSESVDDFDAGNMRPHPLRRQKTMYQRELRLDFGDFIVLELLRLKKITKTDLEYIKELFDMLDEDGDGLIIKPANMASPHKEAALHPSTSLYGSLSTIPEDDHEDSSSVATRSAEGDGGRDDPALFPSAESGRSFKSSTESLRATFARARAQSRSNSVKFNNVPAVRLPNATNSSTSLSSSDASQDEYSEMGVELSPSTSAAQREEQARRMSAADYFQRAEDGEDEEDGGSPASVSPLYDETPTSYYSSKEYGGGEFSPRADGSSEKSESSSGGDISSAYNALILPTMRRIQVKAKGISRLRSASQLSKQPEYLIGSRRKTDIDIESLREELLHERTALLDRSTSSSKYTKSEP